MADLYGSSNAYSPTVSSSSASLPLESEDLSTFLRQFLHPSSASSNFMPFRGHQLYGASSSSSVSLGLHNSIGSERNVVTIASRIGIGPSTFVTPSSSEINFSESGGYFGTGGTDVDGSRKGFSFMDELEIRDHLDRQFMLEKDEIEFRFDYENGGGSTSEMCANPVKSRSSSKRSRAAEVHNLSEKRRRSRINEKLKALQKLIPNSNKSDKASMLDEAIEYLKQLQLQVQTLSLRNGVSLHPLCVPGVAQPLHPSHEGTSYGGCSEMLLSMGKDMSTTTSRVATFPSNQEPAVQPSFEISNHGNSSSQPVQPSFNNIPNSELTFGFDQHWKLTTKTSTSPPTPRTCRAKELSYWMPRKASESSHDGAGHADHSYFDVT